MVEHVWNKNQQNDTTEKRRVVLGITGSIAAYKAAELARLMVSWGYEVRCIMTPSAQEFITPMTIGAVTGNAVTTEFWDSSEAAGIGHIQLADWAQLLVIAPATADCIAKLANGFADSPLTAVALATKAPILIAPAMNVNMLDHPKTQENIAALRSRGVRFVDPGEGALACGWNGAGRLAEPYEIFYHVRRALSSHDFHGKHVLISTGPTREYIDPVRYISNRSSGKMGVALTREAYRRGADITLVHGPVPVRVPQQVRCVQADSAQHMHDVMLDLAFGDGSLVAGVPSSFAYRKPDIVIMSAAVADFRPEMLAADKMKKADGIPVIRLVENPDILAALGERKKEVLGKGTSPAPQLVGFAVETGEIDDLVAEAHRKLKAKGVDLIVGNFAQDAFDLDTNRAWLVDKNGRQEEIATSYKSRVANKVLDAVIRL
jgi:phosphopantothenoylcysteine decarboxylase/phosphopantothenate--cysteine ligase